MRALISWKFTRAIDGRLNKIETWPLAQSCCQYLRVYEIFSATSTIPGHVEATGNNDDGRATPPILEDVVAIAAGAEHSLALRANGTVVAWGSNTRGESTVPPGLANVVGIAAGLHSVALKSDGTVVVWGDSRPEVLNPPAGLNDVIAIAASGSIGSREAYTVALRGNGKVVSWGVVNYNQTNVPPSLDSVVDISAGTLHALAVRQDGTVVGWGLSSVASPPPGLANVIAARSGQGASFAIKSDRTLVRWGEQTVEMPPGGNSGFADIQLGLTQGLALLTNGNPIIWGQINQPFPPSIPPGLTNAFAIAAGGNHALFLTARPLITFTSPSIRTSVGTRVTFSVNAIGPNLRYQWYQDGVALIGKTNAGLSIASVQPKDAGAYILHVSNAFGTVPSQPIVLSFPPPVITQHPVGVTLYRGESTNLTAAGTGLEPLGYQWFKDNVALNGATNSSLALVSVRKPDAGVYTVAVTDAARASTMSGAAVITVLDPTGGNLSLVPVVDTTISSSGFKPQGEATILAGARGNSGIDRALVRFDLSSIPTNAVVSNANFQLTVVRGPPGGQISTFSIHRVLKAWESSATWTIAAPGSNWAGPGGLAGTDFVVSPSAERAGPSETFQMTPNPGLMEDLQHWIANPQSNYGWLLKSSAENAPKTALHFGSKESLSPPRLSLSYTVPPPITELSETRVANNDFSFSFAPKAGWIYHIEQREHLDRDNWVLLRTIPGGAATAPLIFVNPRTNAHQFFRVRTE